MVKKRTPSYISREKILTSEEFEKYKEYKKKIAGEKYRQEIPELEKKSKEVEQERHYRKTTGGKIGSGFAKGISFIRRGATKSLYRKSSSSGVRTGRRGRRTGSVKYTDPRTGQPIGVHEYRKILNARLRAERMEDLRRRSITPEQQRYLARIEQRNVMQRADPERRTIPDTYGNVALKGIMNEIDEYANLVD